MFMSSQLALKNMGLILRFLGSLLVLDSILHCMVQAKVQYYDFVLKETNFTRLCSTKSMLTVNDSFPGPTIRVNKGDTVYVNVHNKGKYGVTIHCHFTSSMTTYPFPKPYGEQTLVLGEWFKGDVMAIIDEALATGGDPNTSDAFTINGQPGDLYDCSNGSTYRLLVNYGKTYLLRIINAVMNEEQFFGIANHKLTVVGMDGAYTKPIVTNYIMITPGQTMDVLVTANQSPSLYYIVSTPFADTTAPFDNTTTTAILQYQGKYTAPSSIPFPTLPSYNDKAAADNYTKLLRSLANKSHPVKVPVNITQRIFMTVSVNQLYCPNASCSGPDGNRLAASLNNISFQTPTIDVLQAYYGHLSKVFSNDFPKQPPYFFNFTGDVGNNTLYPSLGTKVLTVNYNDAVEIVYQGTNVGAAENHPMHLHGYSFYVVGLGSGNFNNITDPKSYNLVDPPLVNTIGVPKNGWATIRFIANNPGVWFMHCHLERHASWGMDTVLVVKNGSTRETSIRPPPKYMPPCSKT
ncbi:Laccase-14 [Morella rubra]|uniref:Laccase n=1 Tax=Morella rubra TaxID=262757 RepID=A0A6A1W646_9ROSI|nr:Laccase-14 [Morella rubra]